MEQLKIEKNKEVTITKQKMEKLAAERRAKLKEYLSKKKPK